MLYPVPSHLEQSSITTVQANLMARFSYLSQAPQAELVVEPEYTWFKTNIHYPYFHFNLVLESNLTTPESAYTHIQHVTNDARRRNTSLYWVVTPATYPTDLGYYLQIYRFQHLMTCTGMTLELTYLNEDISTPADLLIERVTTLTQLEQFVNVLAENSKMPAPVAQEWLDWEISLGFDMLLPRQRYLAYWQGWPVATCTTLSGAGVVGLYYVATLPQERGQDIGAAICLTALRQARRVGHQRAVLTSTPLGLNIYRQLGFQPVGEFNLYHWSPRNGKN